MAKKTISSVMHNVNVLYNTDFDNVDFGKVVTIHETKSHQQILNMVDKLRDVIKRMTAAEAEAAYQSYISPDTIKALGDTYSASELQDIFQHLLHDKQHAPSAPAGQPGVHPQAPADNRPVPPHHQPDNYQH